MTIRLMRSSKPLTHMLEGYGQGKLTQDDIDNYEDHPEELGLLVLRGFDEFPIIVLGVIYDEEDDDDEEDW